jgi:hypothetical protein
VTTWKAAAVHIAYRIRALFPMMRFRPRPSCLYYIDLYSIAERDIVTSMHPHKNEPCQESNRARLARVKKVMDEPRMSESAREEESHPEHAAKGEVPSMLEWMRQMEKNNGKANHRNS